MRPVALILALFLLTAAAGAEELIVLHEDGLAAALEPFVAAKRAQGWRVRMFEASDVQGRGRDRAEQLKRWLIRRFDDGELRHLLLVGSLETFPMRICQIDAADPGTRVASDLYYADLDGDWDADGDGVYGEFADDRPDFVAELAIGRIPFNDPALVTGAVERILIAQQLEGDWRQHCLLVGGTIIIPGDAQTAAELIRTDKLEGQGWQVTRAYPSSQPFPYDVALVPGCVQRALATTPSALTFIISHGSTRGLGSRNPDGYEQFIRLQDLPELPSGWPTVIVSFSCNAGEPLLSDGSLAFGARSLATGAAGFLGATIVVDPTTGGGAGMEAEFELAERLAAGETLGQAATSTIQHYAATGLQRLDERAVSERQRVWRHAMCGVIYGDPSMRLGALRQRRVFR